MQIAIKDYINSDKECGAKCSDCLFTRPGYMDMASEENFPGLNKRHGFFKVIERNQKDRDHYHQKVEQKKQAQQEAVIKEKKSRRRPPAELYRPPGSRHSNPEKAREGVYCLEIEVGPDKWHHQVIEKFGQANRVSRSVCRQYRLEKDQQEAITEMIEEFENSLTLS